MPFVARGSGTGLSGGALPVSDGVLIVLARMRRILEVDLDNQRAVVEPGVINLQVTQEVAPDGFYYAPDPSSQQVCTIGGNVAENSGGAHCLKYGFTTNHVTGLEVVLPDGELVHLGGGKAPDPPGYDLLGAFVGSEGTLGIATKVTLRLLRKPEAVRTLLAAFESTDDAGDAVSRIIGAGIVPAAIEMMDALAIEAAEAAVHVGYPEGAGAVLVVELDGPGGRGRAPVRGGRAALPGGRLDHHPDRRRRGPAGPVLEGPQVGLCRRGADQPRLLRPGRRHPPHRPARGPARGSPSSPSERGLRVANVFHAGDGNLHPLVLYDGEVSGQEQRAEELAAEILYTCLDARRLDHRRARRRRSTRSSTCPRVHAPRTWTPCSWCAAPSTPTGAANPGKVFPTPRLCGERPGPRRVHAAEQAGLAEVF